MKKLLPKNIFFLIAIIVLCVCLCPPVIAASAPEQSSSADPNAQSKLTEQLWTMVRSLGKLRSDYYQKQNQYKNKIQQLRDTSEKLQAQVEQLRHHQNQINKNLSEIQSDIQTLQAENKQNKSTESSTAKKLDQFITEQTAEIEKGIPYRKDDRLTRLQGDSQKELSLAGSLGRIWNFSQEELRIARSGETFTDLIELQEARLQYARLFRIGHQILGYRTEQSDQAGIWVDGTGWKKSKEKDAESVKAAVGIMDQRRVPQYVQLPVKIDTVDIKNKDSKN